MTTTPDPTPIPPPIPPPDPDLVQLIRDARRVALTTNSEALSAVDLRGLRDQARQVVERLDEWIAERRIAARAVPLAERLAAAGIPVPAQATGDPGE